MIVELPRAQLAPGYAVSRLLKGGWQLAGGHGAVDVEAALADMDRFVDAGITTFDCADIYSGVEALIGEWLKRHRARAAAVPVQVHTKYVPDLDRLPSHSRADVVHGVDRDYYGPTNRAYRSLDDAGQKALRDDLTALWTRNHVGTEGTTRVLAEYIEVIGTRT